MFTFEDLARGSVRPAALLLEPACGPGSGAGLRRVGVRCAAQQRREERKRGGGRRGEWGGGGGGGGTGDRGRPVRDAGHPAVTGAGLWRHASRHGIGRQRQHDRHGGGRSPGGLFQPAHPAAPGHCRQPGLAVDPDRVARDRPRPRHLHRVAGSARHLHVRGLHADAGLSRRTVQHWRCRRGARGLRHRQCREQSVRSPSIGCRSRPSGPRQQFLCVRFAQPQRCRAGLVLARAHAPDDGA